MFDRAQVAVRDAVRAEDADLLPHRAQERVVDGVGVEGLERLAVDVVVRDEHRIGAHLGDGAQSGRAHADVARLQRHQCLVLHRPAQRDERALVADVLQPEPPVEAEQEIGRALGGAADLDQELRAVVEGGEEDARPAPSRG